MWPLSLRFTTKIQYTLLISPMCVTSPTYLNSLDLMMLTISGKQYKLLSY